MKNPITTANDVRRSGRALSATPLVSILAAILGLLLFSAGANAQQYSVTDLGGLSNGSIETYGYGINSAGQVTGKSRTSGGWDDFSHAFLSYTNHYNYRLMVDIGILPGDEHAQYLWSAGYGINASGHITGYSSTGTGIHRAFVTGSLGMIDLGSLGGRYHDRSEGRAINASGQVTGFSQTAGGSEHAFLYTNGVMTDLTPGSNSSRGYGINSLGQVVGISDERAFLYTNGTTTDLGTLGGYGSAAYGINDAGQVTGSSLIDGNAASHAFLYNNGTMIDLGTLGGSYSEGLAINSSGQVVGYSMTADGKQHAFLYTNGTMIDLYSLIDDPSGAFAMYVVLEVATAINDNGWIIVNGYDSRDGERRAYLLAPAPVPLPAAAWLMLSGLAGLAGLTRHRRSA